MLVDPVSEANVRASAMCHAVATATPGESPAAVLGRATLYARWVLEPVTTAQAEERGEALSPRLQ